jgi:hypothetical protein
LKWPTKLPSTYHINEIAKHIQRFWAPSMRLQLIALVAQGDPQIHKRVNIAVTQLSDYPASP